MRISLYFLHSEPKLENRGTGVGYKIPPAEVYKRSTLPGLFRLPTLCDIFLNSLDHPDFSDNELPHSSTELLQIPSGLHYQPIFYSDQLFFKFLPNSFRPRTTLFRTSSELRQYPSFSDDEISTVTRLHPNFYDGRSPSEFYPSSCESQTSTANSLL